MLLTSTPLGKSWQETLTSSLGVEPAVPLNGSATPLRVALVMGTRPEAIKLVPVLRALRERPAEFDVVLISTAQHRQMLDQVLALFGIVPDVDLDLMAPNQTLSGLSCRVLQGMERALVEAKPAIVLVQGDTTTAFAAALAAFYLKIPVGHVEAGLRSFDPLNPFPEEINRRLTSVLTKIHFVPTSWAKENLLKESIATRDIVVTGNTVVDSVKLLLDRPFSFEGTPLAKVPFRRDRVLLVTSHRRENFGAELENICLAVRDLITIFPDLHVVFPVHLNPNVRGPVTEMLGDMVRIHLTGPLDYQTFLNAASHSCMVLTDSGGVQEEAPTLRKPLLVLRKVTERPEASIRGLAKVVGTLREEIVVEASRVLSDEALYHRMSSGENPYGDGRAAARIVEALARWGRQEQVLLPLENQFQAMPEPAFSPSAQTAVPVELTCQ